MCISRCKVFFLPRAHKCDRGVALYGRCFQDREVCNDRHGRNIHASISHDRTAEQITELLSCPHVKVERIVSRGQASAPDFWYDQDWAEWVLVLAGSAGLMIEGESAARNLAPGDYVYLPPHVRHRVAWTDAAQPTIWLAVHHPAACRP
jgi:cupin 2 domain-containing protein